MRKEGGAGAETQRVAEGGGWGRLAPLREKTMGGSGCFAPPSLAGALLSALPMLSTLASSGAPRRLPKRTAIVVSSRPTPTSSTHRRSGIEG